MRPVRTMMWLMLAALGGCGRPGEPPSSPSLPVIPASAASVDPAHRPPSGPPREITFDDIKFDMDKESPFTRDLLPKRVTDLARQRIRIRGYILPSFQQRGLTQFVLVRDNMECCFGPGAALYDCVVVRMRPGKSADFSIRPVAVAGTFRLEELRGPDGKHLAIYAMEGESVE